MSSHLGLAATAFVDGELDHVRRDEVLAHLTHCDACRVEVEELRRFKAALRVAADAPFVPMDLTARLLAATQQQSIPLALPAPHAARRSVLHPRVRRTAMGGAFVALGLGGALTLAGPPPREPVAPVDPTSLLFVTDHGTTSTELPFTELDVVSVARTLP